MRQQIRIPFALLATLAIVGCQSNPLGISEETVQEARAEHEEQKAKQIHDEYWQAQMEREEAMEASRERASERARQRRAQMGRD